MWLPVSKAELRYNARVDSGKPSLQRCLEQVLALAAADKNVLEALISAPEGTMRMLGLDPSPAELAMLKAVPEAQLRAMVAALPPQLARVQPPLLEDSTLIGGVRPDLPSAGARPDGGPIRGIRPGVGIAVAATAVALGAGAVALCSTGHRGDTPAVRAEQPRSPDAGSAPDGPRPEGKR
jgi:hypothetical protein